MRLVILLMFCSRDGVVALHIPYFNNHSWVADCGNLKAIPFYVMMQSSAPLNLEVAASKLSVLSHSYTALQQSHTRSSSPFRPP
jgi:hypothetical protein